jgi:D-glycero-beta-D-manno-heptose 1-phosphate adenylyltransferase
LKVVFLDRDNTLNPDPGYISKPEQISLFEDTVEALQLLQIYGYKFIIISNQSGIGRGYFTEQELKKINAKLGTLLSDQGIHLTDFFYCPHKPGDQCNCRKPSPGLIEQAIKKYPAIELQNSFIIGDKVSDVELALHFPITPIQVRASSPDKSSSLNYPVLENLRTAAHFILEECYNRTWNNRCYYFNEIEKLRELIDRQKSKSLKTVFTNGCFDILHPGHLQYLQQAKKLGDRLIVGLNSDESVKNLKGPGRPINSEQDRALMLLNTEPVDYVLIFNQPTPEETIRHLKPDVHVKGGDYKLEELPEGKLVQDYGGKVVILPFRLGYSTTSIIQKMR